MANYKEMGPGALFERGQAAYKNRHTAFWTALSSGTIGEIIVFGLCPQPVNVIGGVIIGAFAAAEFGRAFVNHRRLRKVQRSLPDDFPKETEVFEKHIR